MRTTVFLLLIGASLLFSQSNTWTKAAGRISGNGFMPLMLYSPQTKEYVLNFGELSEEGLNCLYQVQVYTHSLSKWINALPHDTLYGKWADSTGYAYGKGRVGMPVFSSYYWTWGLVDGYLRPSSVHPNARVYGQGCYDSDNGRFYFYLSNTTVSYDPLARRFDSISVATHPNAGGIDGFLKWGAMAYDAFNHEVLLFGGGALDKPQGSPMTWTFDPSTRVWTKLPLAVQPKPRANSPMVYDPVNHVIVLFGGDHMDYCMNDTWIYHCATRTWEKKTPAVSPRPRAGHGFYYLPKQGKIALMGGYRYSTDQRSEFEIWTYDVSANTWGLVKRFSAGQVWPLNFSVYSPMNYLSTCDTGDVVIALADTAPSIYSFSPSTFRLACDVSVIDAGGTSTYGSRSDTVEYRTSPNLDPAFLQQGVPATDTAATEAALRNLPVRTWTRITPPKTPPGNGRAWGTTILDTDRDQFLYWGGGHVTWCGTDVDHYRIHANRWAMSYVPEFPMEWDGYNNPNCGPFTFTDRPFIPMHAVKSYAYDVMMHKMVHAGYSHTYVYDPDLMDWDSLDIHPPAGYAGVYGAGLLSTPHGAFNWATSINYQPARFFLFDAGLMNWKALAATGDASPGYYADANGVAYDSRRDRVIWLGQGAAYAYSFADQRCTNLHPADSALSVGDDHFRECVYIPNLDMVIVEIRKTGGHLAYDCAANQWTVFTVSGANPGVGRSAGMMYDARRNLVWLNTGSIYAMRPDPAMAGITAALCLPAEITGLAVSPNPFNRSVALRLSGALKRGAAVKVFDLTGRVVADLSGTVRNGVSSWNGSSCASGIYVLMAQKGNTILRRKIVLAK